MQVGIIIVALKPKVNASKNRVKSIKKNPAEEKVHGLTKKNTIFCLLAYK